MADDCDCDIFRWQKGADAVVAADAASQSLENQLLIMLLSLSLFFVFLIFFSSRMKISLRYRLIGEILIFCYIFNCWNKFSLSLSCFFYFLLLFFSLRFASRSLLFRFVEKKKSVSSLVLPLSLSLFSYHFKIWSAWGESLRSENSLVLLLLLLCFLSLSFFQNFILKLTFIFYLILSLST